MLTNTELLFITTKGTGSKGEEGKELQDSCRSYVNTPNNELIEMPFIACRQGTGADFPTLRFEYENIETGEIKQNRVYVQDSNFKYFKVSLFTTGRIIYAQYYLYKEDGSAISLTTSKSQVQLLGNANFSTYKIRLISFHCDKSDVENYKIISDEPETEQIHNTYLTERVVGADVCESYELDRNVVENAYFTAPTERVAALEIDKGFEVKRDVRAELNKSFSASRDIKSRINKLFPTKRTSNFFYIFRFKTERSTTIPVSKTYLTERKVTEELIVNKKFSTQRSLCENVSKIYRRCFIRTVNGKMDLSCKTARSVRENIIKSFDNERQLITYKIYPFEATRDIRSNLSVINPARRRLLENIGVEDGLIFPTERELKNVQYCKFGVKRDIRTNVSKKYVRLTRNVLENALYTGYVVRVIGENKVLKFATQRDVIENGVLKFATQRDVIFDEIVNSPVLRDILEDTNFKNKVERYVTMNYSDNHELKRDVLEDIEKINETIRCTLVSESINGETNRNVIVNANNSFATRRTVCVNEDENKFVSKRNLLVYTHLLKQEIAEYIDARVEQILKEKGL